MAENGFLEPLLNNLVEGTEDVQMEMVSYLGELALESSAGHEDNRRGERLRNSNQNGPEWKLHDPKGSIQLPGADFLLPREQQSAGGSRHGAHHDRGDVRAQNPQRAYGFERRSHRNPHQHTRIEHRPRDELNMNLIKMLLSLSKLPKSLSTVVSVMRETEAIYTVVEFLNAPSEELTVVAAKLLITLSSHSGHTIAEGLCKTRGQPESLIKNFHNNSTTEKHAVFVNLLAKLPHQNITLNLALLEQGAVPIILDRIQVIQRGESRTSRYAKLYIEGLVGVIVRFTATLYDADILQIAIEHNLTSVLAELLVRTAGSDEVQRLAAVGLANLSSESVNLSKQPDTTRQKKRSILPKSFSLRTKKDDSKGQRIQLCPVHKGVCSASATFCLLDSRAVERLLGCLEHENPTVVEAALSALATLLDERVDVEKSVEMLSEVDGVRHVLRILREHKEQKVWQKSFWVIEKFLANGNDRSFRDISSDRVLPSALLMAFHRGDGGTKQAAENVLRHLKKMPQYSGSLLF